ncbi:MAG: hypothetical protein OIF34_08830 [Porticoccaceae bacterium]|nr:hypothetical protein [Porticoccaceae bacterium]
MGLCISLGTATTLAVSLLLLTACGGGGGNSTPTTPAPAPGAQNVIGASSQQRCESAASRDASACFVISGNQAMMYGVLGATSPQVVKSLVDNHKSVTEIVMVDVPGSIDDDQNIAAARAVRAAGLHTRIEANGSIASGGVDFFLAGVQRTIIRGATLGVHSWSDGVIEGASLPRSDNSHRFYIDYYQAMGLDDPSGFYFFTLDAASSSDIHNMTEAEITRWKLATPIVQQVQNRSGQVVVSPGNRLGKHQVHISQDGIVYIEGDDSDTQFNPGKGVSYINGGAGKDTAAFSGPQSEYTIDTSGGTITVVDAYYSRNGIAILENIESLLFSNPLAIKPRP